MKHYHFSCGNSSDGAVGFCARVRAHSREEALDIICKVLPEDLPVKVRGLFGEPEDNERVDYVEVYFGVDNITVDDIDEVSDDTTHS